MREKFLSFTKKEKKIQERRLREETEKAIKEKKEVERQLEEMRILNLRNERTNILLEKYPEVLALRKYQAYLEDESKTMDGSMRVKELHFVYPDGEEPESKKAERFFLSEVYIKKDQWVLILQNKKKWAKDLVFDELVDYYSDDVFQRRVECGECRIKKYSQQALEKVFNSPKYKDLMVKNIRFFTAVGTPLDFSFGFDFWIEIENENGDKERIFIDLKTGRDNNSGGEYADLVLNLESENGVIDLKNRENYRRFLDFLYKVADIYKQKIQNKES